MLGGVCQWLEGSVCVGLAPVSSCAPVLGCVLTQLSPAEIHRTGAARCSLTRRTLDLKSDCCSSRSLIWAKPGRHFMADNGKIEELFRLLDGGGGGNQNSVISCLV